MRTIVVRFVAIALIQATLAHAETYEVTRAGQLDSLIGTPQMDGTAANGDRIHIHSGTYVAPIGGWQIEQSLEIFGDGAGTIYPSTGTVLRPGDINTPVLAINLSRMGPPTYPLLLSNLYIHDLQISSTGTPGTLQPDGNGISFTQGSSNAGLVGVRLERLTVMNMGNDGIHFDPGDGYSMIWLSINNCDSRDNKGRGLYVAGCTMLTVRESYLHRNGGEGASLRGCAGADVLNSTFEENAGGTFQTQLFVEGAHAFTVEGCHFEHFDLYPPALTAIFFSGNKGGRVGSNIFTNSTAVTGSRGILIWGTNANPPVPQSGIVIDPNQFYAVDVFVEVMDVPTVTNCVIFPQADLNDWGQVGAAKIIVPEAVDRGHLVLPPTRHGVNLTAGIEFPRLSAARRDSMSAPASGGTRREGLVIYNNDTKRLNYWDASRWRENIAYFPLTSAENAPPGGIILPAITTTQANAIPTAFKVQGALIFNISAGTSGRLQYWDTASSSWKDVRSP